MKGVRMDRKLVLKKDIIAAFAELGVEKGQSIGTVGNTAAFEIADTPHLHFEMMKDSNYVDPNIYLK